MPWRYHVFVMVSWHFIIFVCNSKVCWNKKKEVMSMHTENRRVFKVQYKMGRYPFDQKKERIIHYWAKRKEGFLEQRREELHSSLAQRWMEQIEHYIPKIKSLNILDIGCGAGFFSILLAKKGHRVVGVDLTPEMVEAARILAKEENVDGCFQIMDAENLKFENESFDVIISRNLTWTLPNAAKAYQEWCRVLKQDGVLLNFDANYGTCDFTDTSQLPEEHAHNQIEKEMMMECETIKRQLAVNHYSRPAWDLDVLQRIGVRTVSIDFGISDEIYREKDAFYNPVRMFCIAAQK